MRLTCTVSRLPRGDPGFTNENVSSARNYFKQAVNLDPKFALAWAALVRMDTVRYAAITPPVAGSREEARQAAETALALQPSLGEAFLAMAEYHSYCLNDYSAAEHYLERARPDSPKRHSDQSV